MRSTPCSSIVQMSPLAPAKACPANARTRSVCSFSFARSSLFWAGEGDISIYLRSKASSSHFRDWLLTRLGVVVDRGASGGYVPVRPREYPSHVDPIAPMNATSTHCGRPSRNTCSGIKARAVPTPTHTGVVVNRCGDHTPNQRLALLRTTPIGVVFHRHT